MTTKFKFMFAMLGKYLKYIFLNVVHKKIFQLICKASFNLDLIYIKFSFSLTSELNSDI